MGKLDNSFVYKKFPKVLIEKYGKGKKRSGWIVYFHSELPF